MGGNQPQKLCVVVVQDSRVVAQQHNTDKSYNTMKPQTDICSLVYISLNSIMKNSYRHRTGNTMVQHSGLKVVEEQLPIRLASETKTAEDAAVNDPFPGQGRTLGVRLTPNVSAPPPHPPYQELLTQSDHRLQTLSPHSIPPPPKWQAPCLRSPSPIKISFLGILKVGEKQLEGKKKERGKVSVNNGQVNRTKKKVSG